MLNLTSYAGVSLCSLLSIWQVEHNHVTKGLAVSPGVIAVYLCIYLWS